MSSSGCRLLSGWPLSLQRLGLGFPEPTPEVLGSCHKGAVVPGLAPVRTRGSRPASQVPHSQGPDSEMVCLYYANRKQKNSPSVNRRKVLVKLLIIILLLTK